MLLLGADLMEKTLGYYRGRKDWDGHGHEIKRLEYEGPCTPHKARETPCLKKLSALKKLIWKHF